MNNQAYTLLGSVISSYSKRGIPHVKVEAWDEEGLHDDYLGIATTDENGDFQIKFDSGDFR